MKYGRTNETKKTVYGVVLHRIRALRDIPRWGVHKGDLGGWVEKKSNLSQYGDAWIGGNAMVHGSARVSCDAHVFGDAVVRGAAQVSGSAWVHGSARVFGDAMVSSDAVVRGDAQVSGEAIVSGNTVVRGDAQVSGEAIVSGGAVVSGDAHVFGEAVVGGDAEVSGSAEISGDAVVRSSSDYAVFKNFWSSGRWFTYTRSNKMWRVGCFYGTGEDLIKKAYADSDRSGRCYEAIVRAVEAIESATAKEGGKK